MRWSIFLLSNPQILLNSWNVLNSIISVGPQTDISLLQDRHVEEGGIVTVTCSLSKGDPPLSFEWTKDGSSVASLPGVQVVSHDFSSMLTITAASRFHSGNYYCKASNPVSWSMMKARILVDGTIESF